MLEQHVLPSRWPLSTRLRGVIILYAVYKDVWTDAAYRNRPHFILSSDELSKTGQKTGKLLASLVCLKWNLFVTNKMGRMRRVMNSISGGKVLLEELIVAQLLSKSSPDVSLSPSQAPLIESSQTPILSRPILILSSPPPPPPPYIHVAPLWSIGHPWNTLFHFSFLILRQSVGLL
jgi:hypothetical protein